MPFSMEISFSVFIYHRKRGLSLAGIRLWLTLYIFMAVNYSPVMIGLTN